ncbi:MAG: S-layer homology domain-containing protein [Faecousia sp.]
MKTTTRSRLLAWLLTIAMVLTLVPTVAFAAETATYTKVTDASTLAAGDKVVIVANDYDYALGTNQKTNNRDAVAVTKTDNSVAVTDAVQVLTLEAGTKEGTFAFNTGSGYLYAASSEKNYLKTESALSDNSSWAITIEGGIATVKAQGTNTRNWMRYNPNNVNNGTPLFACYASGQQDICIYRLEGGTNPDPAEPDGIVPIATALAGDDGVSFTVKGVVTLVDGQNIYLQDDTGAICVRMSSKPTDIALGDTVIGTGSKTVYNDLPQLGSGTYEKSEGLTLTAKETTISALTAADICTYVKLSNLEVTEVYDNDGTYANPNITVKDSLGNTIQLYRAVTTKTDDAWDIQVGDTLNVTAALSIFKGTYQLRNTLASEIEKVQYAKLTDALADGDRFVIYYNKDGLVMNGTASGNNLTGTATTLNGQFLTVSGEMAVLTAAVDENGDYTFTNAEGKYLTSGATGNSLTFADEASDYSLWILEATDGGWLIKNKNAVFKEVSQYMEIYNGLFTTFSLKETSNKAFYTFSFYALTDEKPAAGGINEGDAVVIYNLSAEGVLALQDDNVESPSITPAAAVIESGKATVENGGLVFTVEKNGDYYRFRNETFGYLCSNGTGNNAFYAMEASEDADWTLAPQGTGYTMESRTAKYNGKYSQYLEYYAGAFKTYSMYNVTDYDIYTFQFYPCANESITAGVVNQPTVTFGALPDAYVSQDYTLTFTVEAVFGVKELTVTLGSDTLTASLEDGTYTVTIPAELVTGEKLTVLVSGVDNKDVAFSATAEIAVKDEPVISDLTPASGSETKENKRPVISASVSNAGENPTVTMTVNNETVNAVFQNGKVSYTPAADIADGRVNVTVTVTRADGKSAVKSWSFTVGEAQYQLYFGQLHSHTGQYSDGSGTLQSALDYIQNLPESANVDFVAFTDHSNYFDKSGAANPEGALYDMSLATEYSQGQWKSYKDAVAAFNDSQSDVVAIGGFEMTWSGGPGHINTFVTPGIVSRNNTTLNNKTGDAGMKAYYALLSQAEGADSISQFNHPGSTFGTFSDFSYWDALIDTRIYLVEVGNGEGQIGAGGYYPSYEYYTMALDKGWHLAPTNNQDNHKGKWGNANDARDVILTDDFSEEGIYEAIRNYRVYATEDKNLEIRYTVNGLPLGSVISEVPEALNLNVQVYDPDVSDSISKVEVIVNSGKVAYTWDNAAQLASGELTCTLDPVYSYYYIRVTEGDGDLAVTAPVWVGETLKLGISSMECGTATPVTDEELEITTTLFNSEATDATVKSVTYTTNGSVVLGTDTTGYTVPASGTLALTWKYTPTMAKVMTVTANVVMELDGVEYQFSMDVELDVLNAEDLVYIGIDASHYNEYVAGNYKDSMGNFGALAAGYSVRTVELKTSEDLIAACGNEKYKAIILTAPSRRNGSALRDPYATYSDAEVAAIVSFNQAGGAVILCGWGDYYESYAAFPAEDHMAAQQNKLLSALGSSLRISDDETKDDTYNGGQAQRLYLSSYNFDSFLLEGVEYDDENPHNNMYTELYSQYGGASIHVVDAQGSPTSTVPATVTPVVYGFDTTYSADDDKDNYGGLGAIPKYTFDGADRLMVMATEELEGRGLIVVAGAAFLSNFEVQATISDSGSEKNYSNYKICENLVQMLNPVKVTDISQVRAQTETGYKYTIEGVVTSNASGYDKDTAFFDCIYVQDETGGICCFPVAGDYKIGDVVRITGTTDFYQGEPELQVTSIQKLGETDPVVPTVITASELNDRSAEGLLVTVKGTVESFELANGLVQTIMVRDEAGNLARVFIDGYITKDKEIANLEVGRGIEATGLASYDDTFNAPEGPFPRIRIRDRADIVCQEVHVHQWPDWTVVTEPTCETDGLRSRTCLCGEIETEVLPALGHDMVITVVEPTCDAHGYTVHQCSRCDYNYISDIVAAPGHSYVDVKTEPTCTEAGYTTHTCSVCGHSYVDAIVPALGHDYKSVKTDPTHDKMGYTTYTCTVCGHSYVSDYTDALGHHYTQTVTKKPTCTEEGVMTFTCDCGKTYTEAIPMAEHSYKDEITAPTCEHMGYTTHTCTVCQHTYVDSYVDATGHDCEATVVEPTCLGYGYTLNQCKNCDYSFISQITEPTGHDHRLVNAKEATCEEAGYTGDMVCAVCGHVESQGQVIDPKGHTWGDWTVTEKPGCFHEGEQEHTCSVCGKTETEAIPATGENCPSDSFSDLDKSAWYHAYVDFVLDAGYMTGCGNNVFGPNRNLTRAQVVTVLYRMAGSPQVEGTCPFTDVAAGTWYTDAVIWAYQNGIAKGISETAFAPNQAVIREQMVAFLYRYAKSTGMDVTAEGDLLDFTDADAVSPYAVDAFIWAVSNGIVNGMGNNTLAPKATATRAQFAKIIMVLCQIQA